MRKFKGFNIDYSKLDQNTANAFKQLISQSKDIVRDIDDSLVTIKGGLHSELNNLDYDSSGHTGFAESKQMAIFRDNKIQGTNGGTSTAGSWQDRTLNEEQYNNIPDCSLSSNIITLPAGTYYIKARSPYYATEFYQTQLWDNTNSTIVLQGTSEYISGTLGVQTQSVLSGVITITTTTSFKLRYYVTTAQTNIGLGRALNQTNEIYSIVEIEKIA